MPKKPLFTGDETIGDILEQMPEASEILMAHGLSCVSCTINGIEGLKEGVLGHGLSQDDFELILEDLNDAAQEFGAFSASDKKPPFLTPLAAEKVREFQKDQKKEGQGLKVEVLADLGGEKSYFIDFQAKPDEGDRLVGTEGITLFLAPESHKFLMNHQIDYQVTDEGEGFKIEKV